VRDQEGGSNVVDDYCSNDNYMGVGANERLYNSFSLVHPHSLNSRSCPAGGRTKSGDYDQPESETCMAQPRPKNG